MAAAFRYQADALLTKLQAVGVLQIEQPAQLEQAAAAVVAEAKSLAARAIADTRQEVAQLAAELRAAMPQQRDPAGVHRATAAVLVPFCCLC